MKIEEAEKIIDDMYQDRMNTRIEKIEKGIVIDAGKEVTFTKLEEASVILLREELSLKRKIEEQEKIIDFMIDWIRERSIYCVDSHEKLKDYFKKKARDENGNRNDN